VCTGEQWYYRVHYKKFPATAERPCHLESEPFWANFSGTWSLIQKTKTCTECQGEEYETTREQREGAHENAQPQRRVPGTVTWRVILATSLITRIRGTEFLHSQHTRHVLNRTYHFSEIITECTVKSIYIEANSKFRDNFNFGLNLCPKEEFILIYLSSQIIRNKNFPASIVFPPLSLSFQKRCTEVTLY
jgi:hypothetical protein